MAVDIIFIRDKLRDQCVSMVLHFAFCCFIFLYWLFTERLTWTDKT